ncbi:sodium:proton exchanger [Candidatus Campbellbacteria bacterium CG11_big_fil_rev_8_21_14_0_20_44_21]|uniref:Sodium:proton exchanger n=1 Tax=Candidatus Campbellbacteria bacterium CG22_combo_CG10-13_8_21_14_all_43_18 TaxID=1974530 RepID=A0A2H0DX56_9BACT|nr:MAG: sodium:proton exchanger [Candidatus Campbellbacteria bacterium CG22_combo_CG10-13_8_21_14_all_43_18]PIR24319.1 MAG: sodium:proton exchanger [Candidatus Campbellbacteria bacterium CG11_big_fil_rev_8_21_14_0_20_44_21]
MPIILFAIGFYILIKGAQILIRGASSMARIFGLSPWFVGIAIVGIGTSIPELSINLASVWNGQGIGLSTIIGSNTFNILAILGLSALFSPIMTRDSWVKDIWFNLLAITIASIFIIFPILGETSFSGITQIEGFVLLALFSVWMFILLRRPEETESREEEIFTVLVSNMMILGGIVGVFIGGRWVVQGAEFIASALGVSEALIGLSIVAIGTSLPELTVSLTAALKREPAIALGNVVGSNIFDFLGILGLTSILRPISVTSDFRFDIFAALGAGLLLILAVYFNKRHEVTRKEGVLFVLSYVLYLIIVLSRG